jgi:hypothetical protein
MFINIIRVVGYFTFHSRLAVISKTISHCRQDLVHFFIVFATLVFLFAYQAYVTLGHRLEGFKSLSWSLQSMAMLSIGEFDHAQIYQASPIFGSIVFWTGSLLLGLLLMNVLLAILIDGYLAAKVEEMDGTESIFTTLSAMLKSMCIQARWLTHKRVSVSAHAVAVAEDDAEYVNAHHKTILTLSQKARRESLLKLVRTMKPEAEDSDSDESHDADNAIAKLDFLFPSMATRKGARTSKAAGRATGGRGAGGIGEECGEEGDEGVGEGDRERVGAEKKEKKERKRFSKMPRGLQAHMEASRELEAREVELVTVENPMKKPTKQATLQGKGQRMSETKAGAGGVGAVTFGARQQKEQQQQQQQQEKQQDKQSRHLTMTLSKLEKQLDEAKVLLQVSSPQMAISCMCALQLVLLLLEYYYRRCSLAV